MIFRLLDTYAAKTDPPYTFDISLNRHPWPLVKKTSPQIFERQPSKKVIEGNVQGGGDLFFYDFCSISV